MGTDRSEFFSKQPNMETRAFLLTELKNGNVKAERVYTADDPRLSSKEPFLLIAVDTFLLSDPELEALADMGAGSVDRLADGVGTAEILRPRVAKRLGVDGFFSALRDETTDILLAVDSDGEGSVWRAVK